MKKCSSRKLSIRKIMKGHQPTTEKRDGMEERMERKDVPKNNNQMMTQMKEEAGGVRTAPNNELMRLRGKTWGKLRAITKKSSVGA